MPRYRYCYHLTNTAVFLCLMGLENINEGFFPLSCWLVWAAALTKSQDSSSLFLMIAAVSVGRGAHSWAERHHLSAFILKVSGPVLPSYRRHVLRSSLGLTGRTVQPSADPNSNHSRKFELEIDWLHLNPPFGNPVADGSEKWDWWVGLTFGHTCGRKSVLSRSTSWRPH